MRSDGILAGLLLAAVLYLLWASTRGSRALAGITAKGRKDAWQIPIVDVSSVTSGDQIALNPVYNVPLPSWAQGDPNAPWNS